MDSISIGYVLLFDRSIRRENLKMIYGQCMYFPKLVSKTEFKFRCLKRT